MKLETVVVDEEPSDPAEIEGREEVAEVEVEYVAPPLVPTRVGDDRMLASKSVRERPPPAVGVDLVSARIEGVGQVPLQPLELRVGGGNFPLAAAALGDLEFIVFLSVRNFIYDIGKARLVCTRVLLRGLLVFSSSLNS